MRGIAIFSGINYSGKGTVLNFVREEMESVGIHEAKFASISGLMMKRMGIDSHKELGDADPQERIRVRHEVFQELADESQKLPVFIDGHFIFEDGERTDFSPFLQRTKLVVLIESDPEVILSRARQDETSHPGRNALKSVSFIREYAENEKEVARQYVEQSLAVKGARPKLITITNDTNDLAELKREVSIVVPKIVNTLREDHRDVEGRSNHHRRL